ncbi:hypothetical protein [Candidatus Ruminimicrobiellum ovillum]|uniref:hypothetical protein n=1 Tax=Candidatus Ruminimicrobiellum ovillum TaxID=1947927 RepID=UPI003559A192
MLILLVLFILFPAVIFFLVSNTINAIIVSYCLAVLLFIFIRRSNRKEIVLLDTTVINDDRIIDFINSNVYQQFLLPRFVIREIENKIDGLKDKHLEENLEKIKQNKKVKVLYRNYYKIKSSDFKIVKLAKSLNAKIVTVNFSLNKMSVLEGVKVIDLNDMYERLKPTILPGHKITIFLVKEGRDKNQAIGFLDDGTTVVAENGKNFVGKRVNLKITSMLHSSDNKMLFGKIPNEDILEGKL